MRTKGQIRGAKSKGSQFEMDCEYSLQQYYHDCYRTHERGYIKQYDIYSEQSKSVFECKCHKSMSYTQAKKYFLKLQSLSEGNRPYLIYKTNQQPILVMYSDAFIKVTEFTNLWGEFKKHPKTRKIISKFI